MRCHALEIPSPKPRRTRLIWRLGIAWVMYTASLCLPSPETRPSEMMPMSLPSPQHQEKYERAVAVHVNEAEKEMKRTLLLKREVA